jgi:hypothetical protein
MEKDQLIKKVALILGVSENMVKHTLSLESQVILLVEQYERLAEVKGKEVYEDIRY